VAPLAGPQRPEHHGRGEEREQGDEPRDERDPLRKQLIRARLPAGGAPGHEGAPRHPGAAHEEQGHPQKKTPARESHGRPLSQAGAAV
jgi:hypothetical protein